MKTKCRRVVSRVFSTALNGSVNCNWSATTMTKVRQWESQILRLTFRPKMKAGESWVEYGKRVRHKQSEPNGGKQDFHANSFVGHDSQKCGLVPSQNFLDSEIGGCAMLRASSQRSKKPVVTLTSLPVLSILASANSSFDRLNA